VTECDRLPVLRHKNPYLVFARILGLLYPETRRVDAGVDPTAVVHAESRIDPSTGVGPLCHVKKGAIIGRNCRLISSVFVGEDVTIGESCLFHPGVRILYGVKIGSNVILHPGVVVGSDGFGFAEAEGGFEKFPQVGSVEIGDDVEIGANTTIDRGALGDTRIGRGTKIDNLVQIAHNVEIGENCIIVSQVGISGSTKVGNGVILAGQVGLVGHIHIGDQVTVAAQSGVTHSAPSGKRLLGSPARDAMESKRIEAALRRLPELLKRVKELERSRSE
jgi:UDP-3-O-[3-hydroxymyristoyl] glucosamine N-acyltransferase